ncbi:MAG: four helix bundle protein [Spirulinaceae cyanobacterium]
MAEFKELEEWEKAHNLTVAIYQLTRNFPEEELLGLTQQLRLACSSIPIKIAQSCHREERSAQIELLQLAKDSSLELEYYLLLCYELELLSELDYDHLVSSLVEVKELITTSIEKRQTNS